MGRKHTGTNGVFSAITTTAKLWSFHHKRYLSAQEIQGLFFGLEESGVLRSNSDSLVDIAVFGFIDKAVVCGVDACCLLE